MCELVVVIFASITQIWQSIKLVVSMGYLDELITTTWLNSTALFILDWIWLEMIYPSVCLCASVCVWSDKLDLQNWLPCSITVEGLVCFLFSLFLLSEMKETSRALINIDHQLVITWWPFCLAFMIQFSLVTIYSFSKQADNEHRFLPTLKWI